MAIDKFYVHRKSREMIHRIITLIIFQISLTAIAIASILPDESHSATAKNLQEFLSAEYMADNSVLVYFNYTNDEFSEFVQLNSVTEFVIKIHGKYANNDDITLLATESLDPTSTIENWALVLTQAEMDNGGVPFDLLHGLIDINGIACTDGVDIVPDDFTEMPELSCGEDIVEVVDESSPMSSIVAGETYTIFGFPFVAMDQNQGKLSIPFGNSVILVNFNGIQVNEANQVVAGSIEAVSDDGMNYTLDKFVKRLKNGENSTDICVPPPPPPGYDEQGINSTTGLDDWGFNADGVYVATGSQYDSNGFDSEGNYMDTGSPYNPNGCSREGLDENNMDCELSNGVNQDAVDYLATNEASIDQTISQILSNCTSELTTQLADQTASCQTIRQRMIDIVASSDSLSEDVIFGAGNKYLNPGMSAHFVSPPKVLGQSNGRSTLVVELEQKHVDLFNCDLARIALEEELSNATDMPTGFEDQIKDQITQWTEYDFELLSNNPDNFEQWIKNQIETIGAEEGDPNGGGFVEVNEEEETMYTEEELKQKVSDIFAYKNNLFGVEQPVYVSEKKSGANMNALLSQYQSGITKIDGIDRVYYTEQIYEKRLKSGNNDMYNVLPLKLTNGMSDKPYDIFIERIEIGLTGASLDAVLKIEDTKNGGHIVFRGENIGFGTGGLSGGADSYLRLDSELGIRLSNSAKLHLLPTDTYVSWDCNGFKALGVAAEIEFCPEFVKPVINGVVSETENYRLAVQASEVSNWNDFHFAINAEPFVLTKYENIIWELDAMVVDFSTSKTEPKGTLPGYESIFTDGAGNLTNEWEGFYIQNLRATMPKDFGGDISNNSETFEVAVDLAIIDDGGFTGQGSVTTELVSLEEGNLNGWAFSIDKFFLRVVNNQFAGTGFGGGIRLPIMEDTLSYTAEMYPEDKYKFAVGSIDVSQSLLFNSTINLTNSQVVVEKDEEGFHTWADLTGSLVFDQGMADDSDFTGINLPSVTFENFEISNRAPYFTAGTWDIGDQGIGVGFKGFKIELDNIKPYTPDEVGTVGLGFNIAIIISDEMDISAEGKFGIVGELLDDGNGRQKWYYKNLELHGLKVDAPIGSVAHVKGSVVFEKNHPEWGDYFQGAMQVELKKLVETTITGIAQFGTKQNEKYFYVDVMVNLPTGIPVGPIEFTALGLGIYRNVTFSTEGLTIAQMLSNNPDNIFNQPLLPGASLSTGVYSCETNVDFGIKGMAQFRAASEQLLNGTVSLGAEFSGSTLDRMYLIGSAQLLAAMDDGVSSQFEAFKGNDDAEDLPSKPASVSVPMSAYLDFNMDFKNKVFTGDIAAYLNTPLLSGIGTDGAVVVGKIHFGPDDWYIKMGSPTNRAGVSLSILDVVKVDATAYFQVGTNTDPMADIPQEVREIAYSASRNETLLRSGQGLIFGAQLNIEGGIGLSGVAEAELKALAGFDLMLRRYEGLSCQGESDEIGIKGWYASGQLYALLEGKIKVFGIKLFEAGVAAILQAQLPNPFFAEATVAVRAKLLFVTINKSLSIALGKQCVIQAEEPTAVFGADVVASMTPSDGEQEVSVASQPEIHMNFPLKQNISMPSLNGGESTFKVDIKSIDLSGTSSGNIPVDYTISPDGLIVDVVPIITFPANEEITATVTVNLFENGSLLGEQSKTFTFHTGAELTEIPISNVKYSYPIHDMEHYYPEQLTKQFIDLTSGQPDLFEGNVSVFLSSTNGLEIEVPVDYDPTNSKVTFELPQDLEPKKHRLELTQVSQTGERNIIHTINFEVSEYKKFRNKVTELKDNFTINNKGFMIAKLNGEGFSQLEQDQLITTNFGISVTQKNQFLDQFNVFNECGQCGYVTSGILNSAEIKETVISKGGISVTYVASYQRIYNGLYNELIECVLILCGENNPGCSDFQLVSQDRTLKNSMPDDDPLGGLCDIPEFNGLPNGTYRVYVNYKIPGATTDNGQFSFTIN